MRVVAVGVLLWTCMLCGRDTAAQEPSTAITHTTNDTTVLLIRIDSSQVNLPPQLQEIASGNEALGPAVSLLLSKLQTLKSGLQGNTAYLAVDLPYAMRIHARMLVPGKITRDQLPKLAAEMWPAAVGQPKSKGDWLFLPLGSDAAAVAVEQAPAASSASQADAWQAALGANAPFPVQCVVVPPTYIRETFREVEPELPVMLGGGASELLVAGAHWISLGFDPGKLTLRLVVQSESPTAAESLKAHLPKVYRGLLDQAKLEPPASTMIMALLGLLQPKVEGDRLIVALDKPEQAAAIVELAKAALLPISAAQAKAQTANNIKQLGLALHNHESAYKEFPTYVDLRRKQKVSGLSWRVHILPFIEQGELYQQFKLDEPWDSPHNIQLLSKMPQIYQPVLAVGESAVIPAGHTTYVAPIGEQTVFGRDKPIQFGDVTDGTSHTIWLVEVKPEHAIPWTSPEEYPYDPQDPAAKLRVVDGTVNVGFIDGSVHRLPVDTNWHALFTINGGEAIQW